MGNKTALVLGSTGLVGRELTRILLEDVRYGKIITLVRRKTGQQHPKLEEHVVDFERLADHKDLFAVHDVFCCLGTTMKKAGSREAFRKVDLEYPLAAAKLAKEKGVEKFLVITAIGANRRSVFFYNRVKGELEESLKSLHLPSLIIFRPSLLLGERSEKRTGEDLAAALYRLTKPLFIGPLARYSPVEAETVALAMRNAAGLEQKGVRMIPSHEIRQMAKRRSV
jgi:uncharacterized protein YbjT (DUF2867 family)